MSSNPFIRLNAENITLTPVDLEHLVHTWGVQKGILDPYEEAPNYHGALTQLSKTMEEIGELITALSSADPEAIIDAYGDILVTLAMGMGHLKISPTSALEHSYKIIANRKGKMVNGIFVKDSDVKDSDNEGE